MEEERGKEHEPPLVYVMDKNMQKDTAAEDLKLRNRKPRLYTYINYYIYIYIYIVGTQM